MARDRSFKNYISSQFYNEFFSSIENYIEGNYDNLDLDLKKVRSMGQVSLLDTQVKMVWINDLPEMEIGFDVVIKAEIKVTEGDYHFDDFDLCYSEFLLSCNGNLECSLDDFKITGIEVYNQKNKIDKPLSDTLVPYIYKEELDSVAIDFLSRYYPEALKGSEAVNPRELASKMGLTVVVRDITTDLSIFGQVYFHDSEAEFYDSEKDETIIEKVNAGTIFVDPKAYFLRNLGAVNNTIVHECVHWDKHRKAFELERLYNSSADKIKCQVVGGMKGSNRSATDWMEWQANALAPRIQMPLSVFKVKAYEVIRKFKKELGTTEIIDVISLAIDELATFFCVSRLAAKIRMIDAGYEEAKGACIYIDGSYVEPHRFKKGSLKNNQTFSIGAVDAAIQSIITPEIKQGNYLYVKSHFVLNHPKYIEQNTFGQTILTKYGRTHMDECCLIFDLTIKSDGLKERYHTECYLNRDEGSSVEFDFKYNNGYQHASPEKQRNLIKENFLEEEQMFKKLPIDYLTCLKMVKDWRGLTYKKLAEKTLINERTLRGIVNGDRGSIESLVSICLALKLPYKISNHIIENSPYSLKLHDDNHMWYSFVLTHKYLSSMNEISSFLIEQGAEPL